MFFKKSRLKIELEELKSLHRIALAEKDAEFERQKKDYFSDNELKVKELTTLLKLDSEQKTKQLELDNKKLILELNAKHNAEIQAVKAEVSKHRTDFKEQFLEEHYKKLSEAMTKLHSEGNVTTQFTQELALKMMDQAPKQKHKSQIKVITDGTTKK